MAQTLIVGSGAEQVCRMPEVAPLDLMSATPNLPANGNDTVIIPAPVIPIGATGPAPASTARQFGGVEQFSPGAPVASPGGTPFAPEPYGLSQQEFDALPPDLQRMYRANHNGLEYLRQLPQVRDSGDVEGMVREFNNRLQPPRFMDMVVETLADGTEILRGQVRAMRELLGHEAMLKGETPGVAEQTPVSGIAESPGRAVSYALEMPAWARYLSPHNQARVMEAYQDAMARLHGEPWFLALDAEGQSHVRALLVNDVHFDASFSAAAKGTPGSDARFEGLDHRFESLRQREQQRHQLLSPEEAAWRAHLVDTINEGLGVPRVDAAVFVHENRDAIAELHPSWERLSPAEMAMYRFGFPEFALRNREAVLRRQSAMAEARDPRREERREERRPFEFREPVRGVH